jgi:hypothetical protein
MGGVVWCPMGAAFRSPQRGPDLKGVQQARDAARERCHHLSPTASSLNHRALSNNFYDIRLALFEIVSPFRSSSPFLDLASSFPDGRWWY